MILHGDQFDTFITQYKLLTDLACGVFYWIQKLGPARDGPLDQADHQAVPAEQPARARAGHRLCQG